MRERMSDVSKVRTPPLSGPAMFSAPPCSLIRFWLKLHSPLNLSRARRAPACGYVDNARALPTCPTGAASKSKLQFIDEGREAFGPPTTSAPARPPNATKVAAPSMRGFRQPFTAGTGSGPGEVVLVRGCDFENDLRFENEIAAAKQK